jgi:hypothetical protein
MDILENGGCIFIKGSLGGGKTMGAVKLAEEFLAAGRPVASNCDLYLEHLVPNPKDKNATVLRLPDYPKLHDFLSAGHGSETPKRRNTHGLILLDECGTWLNSRDAMDKEVKKHRLQTIKLFLDIRKRGWAIGFIVQDEELVDKQIRLVMMQFKIEMKNTEHMPIPLLGFPWKLLTGKMLTMPKRHLGIVRYVPNKEQMVDWWWFEGSPYYKKYDTEQEFDPDYDDGTYQYLPNYYQFGRYLPPPIPLGEKIKMAIQNYSKHFLLIFGLLTGLALSAATLPDPVQIVIDAPPQQKEEPGTQTPEIDFTDFWIESHYKFGNRTFMTIASEEGKRYTTEELADMGFWLFMKTECNLRIRSGEFTYDLLCKKPEVKYLDPYDFSHLPTGKSLGGD